MFTILGHLLEPLGRLGRMQLGSIGTAPRSTAPLPRGSRKLSTHALLATPLPYEVLAPSLGHASLRLGHHFVNGNSHGGAPMYYTTLCALSVTLGATFYNLAATLSEYFSVQKSLNEPDKVPRYSYGIDVTNSVAFQEEEVLKAVEFAASAHNRQFRKTGEPYVTHCIETALIVEQNLPRLKDWERRQNAVIAAILHDVLDDTSEDQSRLRATFGPDVSDMVEKVSKLSQVNQLLRRDKRKGLQINCPTDWQLTWQQLKTMMVDMALEEPLVILIKLADRLHNMRTVYALQPEKQIAVAEETLEVWCSMAEYLGWYGLKSEMEDLCFAVLRPRQYCQLRSDLDKLWNVQDQRRKQRPEDKGHLPWPLSSLWHTDKQDTGSKTDTQQEIKVPANHEVVRLISDEAESQQGSPHLPAYPSIPVYKEMRAPGVLPTRATWGAALATVSNNSASGSAVAVLEPPSTLPHSAVVESQGVTPTITASREHAFPQDAVLLEPLSQAPSSAPVPPKRSFTPTVQQEQLRSILQTVVPFTAVSFQSSRGVAKSAREGLQILDQCADQLYHEFTLGSYTAGLHIHIEGRLKSLHSVHKKMQRKKQQLDEIYDARALRVIVDDEGGTRMSDAIDCCYRLVSAVQKVWKPIMREFDDYIANPKASGYQALHTAVKGPGRVPMEVQIKTSSMHEHAEFGGAAHWAYKEVLHIPPAGPELLPPGIQHVTGYEGQPVLRIAPNKLRYGVVIRREQEGRRLICVIKSGPTLEDHPTRAPDYAYYNALRLYAAERGWSQPGQGDWRARVEAFVIGRDGRFHRKDHLGLLWPSVSITLLENYEVLYRQEFAEQWEGTDEEETGHADDSEAPEMLCVASMEEDIRAGTVEVVADIENPLVRMKELWRALGVQQLLGQPDSSDALTGDAHRHGGYLPGSEGEAHRGRLPAVEGGGGAQRNPLNLVSMGQATAVDETGFVDPSKLSKHDTEAARQRLQDTYKKTSHMRLAIKSGDAMSKATAGFYQGEEVSVLIWPGATIEQFPRGTTVGEIVREKGLIEVHGAPVSNWGPGRTVVNLNNQLVPESTVVKDGDLVILTREKLKI